MIDSYLEFEPYDPTSIRINLARTSPALFPTANYPVSFLTQSFHQLLKQSPTLTMAASHTSFISGATSGALSKVTPLDSGNYRQWSYSMKMKFLLKGEGVWKLVNPDPRDASNAASAANATVRTQGARTRGTRSPTMQLPPSAADEQKSSKKAAYLIYQSCSTIPQSHIADEARKALYEEFLFLPLLSCI